MAAGISFIGEVGKPIARRVDDDRGCGQTEKLGKEQVEAEPAGKVTGVDHKVRGRRGHQKGKESVGGMFDDPGVTRSATEAEDLAVASGMSQPGEFSLKLARRLGAANVDSPHEQV
jgi:hypothetical protein